LEDIVVDRMILKGIERNICGDVDWICLIQPVVGFYEHGNELIVT
jgi:hypothetical protein